MTRQALSPSGSDSSNRNRALRGQRNETDTPAQMPTSVYRQLDPPLAIEAGPAESVHIADGGDGELELPENYGTP